MRHFLFLALTLGLLSGVVVPVFAQDTSTETWYFAYTIQGQVVAYNLAGKVNTLIETGFEKDDFGYRVQPDSVLKTMLVNGQWGLYYLTSERAIVLDLPPDVPGDMAWKVVASNFPYSVLISTGKPRNYGLIIDVSEGTVATLTSDQPLWILSSVHFSADGKHLRYFSQDGHDQNRWHIRERKLASGDERIFHTFTIDTSLPNYVTADIHGEHWVYLSTEGYQLYTLSSGEIQELTQSGSTEFIWKFIKDELVNYPASCETSCSVELTSLSSGDSQVFTVPSAHDFIRNIARADSSHILLNVGDSTWLLGDDDSSLKIGSNQFSEMPLLFPSALSPDGRYLLTVNPERDSSNTKLQYRLWDVHDQKYVMQSPYVDVPTLIIKYTDSGVLISEVTKKMEIAGYRIYRYEDGLTFELNRAASYVRYFDLVAGGSLLFGQLEADSKRSIGIYLLDPQTRVYTLLVEGGWPLRID